MIGEQMLKEASQKIIENASNTFPAVLMNGPRQVGKTTLFEHSISKSREYVSLDDPRISLLQKQILLYFFKHINLLF
jgi:predicted AAA+ superfamily ATPase